MKRLLALLLVFAVPVSFFSGCSSTAGDGSSVDTGVADTSTGDGKLTIYSFTSTFQQAAIDFQNETGIETDYETIGNTDYQTKLNSILGTDDEPDIVCLDRSYVGAYLPMDDFIDIGATWGDQPELQAYLDNTYPATIQPGYYGDTLKAIGWQCPVGAYFYRSDLASKYLGINSVEEMEDAISTQDKFFALQDQLDATGTGIKLQSDLGILKDAIFSEDQTEPFVTDGTFTITKAFQDDLEEIKTQADRGIYYTYSDDASLINGAKSDGFLGGIAGSWYIMKCQKFEQPGLWRVAQSPFYYSLGGTFMAVTKNADMDLAWDFLKSTMINPQWLANNMDQESFMGNSQAVDIYEQQNPNGSEYFGGQDIVGKFAKIGQEVTDIQPSSLYDSGILNARNACFEGYVLNGTYSTVEQACEGYKAQVQSIYPDLNIVIES